MKNDFHKNIAYLMIEANSSCNLSCIGCTREALELAGKRKNKNISEAEFITILEQVKDCPLEVIKFEGLSEPMMHPDFDKLAAILRSYFSKAQIIVFSNLQYQLTKTPLLKTLPHISQLNISIDGVGETYEAIRVGAKFNRFMESMNAIAEFVPPEERSKKIFLNFTAFESNFSQIPEIYQICSDYGLAGVRINIAQNWDEKELNQHPISVSMISALKKYKKDVRGVGGWKYSDCFWPFRGVVIDVYGDVRQCVLNTTQEPIGNVFTTSLSEIYNASPYLKELREKLENNCAPLGCVTCDYRQLSDTISSIHGADRTNKPFPKHSSLT